MSNRTMRVVIVAATPALRRGLGELAHSTEVTIIGEAARVEELLGSGPLPYVVVIGDETQLPFSRDIALRASWSLVVLSDGHRAAYGLASFPNGWAIVPTDCTADELQSAMRAAARGFVSMPRDVAARLLPHVVAADEAARDGMEEALTPREIQVLELLSEGLPNRAIARQLGISEHTVKFHISALYGKLGATGRTDAVGRAVRRGLIAL